MRVSRSDPVYFSVPVPRVTGYLVTKIIPVKKCSKFIYMIHIKYYPKVNAKWTLYIG